MQSFKAVLEKKTIHKFKYGKQGEEDVFNVKDLLRRNISNHVLKNKKAFVVSKNPRHASSTGRDSIASVAIGSKEKGKSAAINIAV